MGRDPVHPTAAAYRCMAELLELDISDPDSRYTNPMKSVADNKKPKLDLSTDSVDWVTGCSAAAPRRDFCKKPLARGQSFGGHGVANRPPPLANGKCPAILAGAMLHG
jgi:hypothetical protein